MKRRNLAEAPVLTDEERRTLDAWTRRRKTSQALALRARIILLCAEGLPDIKVAPELGTTGETVGKWRRRFLKRRVDGLLDEPRPGAPRKITDEAVEAVVVATLETTPKGATHWSTRELAKQSGVSHSSIGRIWRAFGLAPHRSETFTLSNDPLFVDKVRDVVGLYHNPPDHAVVLCVDEKSQIQALDRSQPMLPMLPGRTERRTNTYKRNGTTSLFAALNVATGQVIGECHRRNRATEFRKFLNTIDKETPAEFDVHMVLDNLSTHKAPIIKKWLAKHPRFHLHFTPTYSSWVNQVERWFGILEQRQLKRGVHRNTAQLERAIYEFIDVHNEEPQPCVWTKTADEILQNIKRFCMRTLDSQAVRTNF